MSMDEANPIVGHIRWMIRGDLKRVLEIERNSFSNPWTEQEFLSQLRQTSTIGMVIEFREMIVGYMVYDLNSRNVKLQNIAVDVPFRRIGIGSQLMDKLKTKLINHREMIDATVSERNLPAQMFLKAHGFRCVNVMSGFYEEPDVDTDAYYFIHWKEECNGIGF